MQGLISIGNLVGISISRYDKCLNIKKNPSVLELILPLNQHYIKIDLNNLQEPNWDEVTEEQKLDAYKFRIDVKDYYVNKC